MASAATTAIAAALPFTKIRPTVCSLQKSALSIPASYSAIFSATPLAIAQFSSRNGDILRRRIDRISCSSNSPTVPISVNNYEFSDNSSDMELRIQLGGVEIDSPKNISVNAEDTSLTVQIKQFGILRTLMEVGSLYDKIKASETIWYLDDGELIINLKKQDPELQWPDIVESWHSLTAGSMQLLKGASIYIVGDSTEINQKVAKELAVGLGYTPLGTKELLETFTKQTIDSWVAAEGFDSVAEAESVVLESVSSQVRTVVATLGGLQGAARRASQWRHLYAGFTVWVSETEAADEDTAQEEARRHKEQRFLGYSNADVVVKLQGWDAAHVKSVAQACLSALKRLILTDKQLPGKKSLYIRLGCRGDWPNIKPPGWDPSSDEDNQTS